MPQRDKVELRAAVQESVLRFTRLQRARLLPIIQSEHPDWTPDQVSAELDQRQPEYQEFDPVVELSIMGADHRNSPELRRQALSEAAQYQRPKLKSIEVRVDSMSEEEQRERAQMLSSMRSFLDLGAQAKRDTIIDVTPNAPGSGPSSRDDKQ